MKLLYKTKKWDNEIRELEDVMRKLKKHSDLDMSQSNIQSVIEIPTFFLEDKLELDKEKYRLFDFENPIIV